MSRPSSRSRSRNWDSNWWHNCGVDSALRNRTTRRPTSAITGIKRTVRGNKEVAKCVAERDAAHVAWFIGASFPVEEQSLVDPVTSRERRLEFQAVESQVGQLKPSHHQNLAGIG